MIGQLTDRLLCSHCFVTVRQPALLAAVAVSCDCGDFGFEPPCMTRRAVPGAATHPLSSSS
jgi:hypothetical protein